MDVIIAIIIIFPIGLAVGWLIARDLTEEFDRPKLQCLEYEDFEHTQTPGLSHRWPSPANLGKGHGTQDQATNHSTPAQTQEEGSR